MSVKNYDQANQENLFAQTNQDSTISTPVPLKKKEKIPPTQLNVHQNNQNK